MKSIEERLAASDPTAAASYAPVNYEAMIQRIVATPYPKPAATWRGFKVKMASSVAAASLLTALGITALNTAGTALPILGFAAANTHPPLKSAPSSSYAPGALMPVNTSYQFTGAGNFSTQAGTGTAYALSAPSDGRTVLEQAANVLKVDLGAPTTGDNGQSFTSGGPLYSGWLVREAGFSSWGINYNRPVSVAVPKSSASPLSSEGFKSLALTFAKELGSFDLGAATIDPIPNDPTAPMRLTVPILIDGQSSSFSYNFTFDLVGKLLTASGQSFSLQPAGSYPLLSLSAGVGEITSQLGVMNDVTHSHGIYNSQTAGVGNGSFEPGAPGSVGAPSAPPTTSDSSGPPTISPSPVTTDSIPTPVTSVPSATIVNLTDASTQYGVFTMNDGTTMLLPIYVYVGTVVGESTYQLSFKVVPINPSYLDLSTVRNYNY